MFLKKIPTIILLIVLIIIKGNLLYEDHNKASGDYDDTVSLPENKKFRNEETVQHVKEHMNLWDDLSETVRIDEDGSCVQSESIKKQTSNLYPFVIIQPSVELPDEFGNVHHSWCDGIMISQIWGIAPPNCFIKDETDYYLNLNEMLDFESFQNNLRYPNRKQRSPKTRTFIAKLQVIIHPDIKYNFLTNTYCNYIALFKLMNLRFYFDFLIKLPKVNYRGDLYNKMHDVYPVDMSQHPAFKIPSKTDNDEEFHKSQSIVDENDKCKLFGGQFELGHISFTFSTFKLTSIREYCTLFPLCSAISCSPTFNYNITYLDLNLPRSPAENGCSFNSGYHFGTSLVCFDEDILEWVYYGMGTNEVVLSCNGANMYNNKDHLFNFPHAYLAFTRVDAYADWINKTINMHGGWKGL